MQQACYFCWAQPKCCTVIFESCLPVIAINWFVVFSCKFFYLSQQWQFIKVSLFFIYYHYFKLALLKKINIWINKPHNNMCIMMGNMPICFVSWQKRTSTVKTHNMKNTIPYVSTHNPQNPEIYNVRRNSLLILEEDPEMKKILDNSQIIKSKRQSPNF